MQHVFWFTGLPCSGKSSLASALHVYLEAIYKKPSVFFDGDTLRQGVCSDLGFSDEDRDENCRRVAHMCSLMLDHQLMPIVALVSPRRVGRDDAAHIISVRKYNNIDPVQFHEIYVKCSVDVCSRRDDKGLYKKAFAGEIPNFTGVNDPYEEPLNPNLVIDTEHFDFKECVKQLICYWGNLQ